jgi:hypothetical protein
MLKMVGTESPLKVLVFTGRSMYLKVIAEQESGRLPKDVRCELASLPPKLLAIVQKVRADSVEEVTPAK